MGGEEECCWNHMRMSKSQHHSLLQTQFHGFWYLADLPTRSSCVLESPARQEGRCPAPVRPPPGSSAGVCSPGWRCPLIPPRDSAVNTAQ